MTIDALSNVHTASLRWLMTGVDAARLRCLYALADRRSFTPQQRVSPPFVPCSGNLKSRRRRSPDRYLPPRGNRQRPIPIAWLRGPRFRATEFLRRLPGGRRVV